MVAFTPKVFALFPPLMVPWLMVIEEIVEVDGAKYIVPKPVLIRLPPALLSAVVNCGVKERLVTSILKLWFPAVLKREERSVVTFPHWRVPPPKVIVPDVPRA